MQMFWQILCLGIHMVLTLRPTTKTFLNTKDAFLWTFCQNIQSIMQHFLYKPHLYYVTLVCFLSLCSCLDNRPMKLFIQICLFCCVRVVTAFKEKTKNKTKNSFNELLKDQIILKSIAKSYSSNTDPALDTITMSKAS